MKATKRRKHSNKNQNLGTLENKTLEVEISYSEMAAYLHMRGY